MWILAALAADPRLAWSEVPYVPAGPEEAGYGPDQLALGPGGAWAFWSPAERLVRGGSDGQRWAVPAAGLDGLAFTAEGTLLVLSARTLSSWEDGVRGGSVRVPDLAFPGPLVVEGDHVYTVDPFQNRHAVGTIRGGRLGAAEGPPLTPPPRVVKVASGVVTVDGVVVPAPADTLAARLYGGWLYLEAGSRGAVRVRQLRSLTTGRVVLLPAPSGPYPARAPVAAGPDGSVGWLEPDQNGVAVRREAP